MPKRRHHGQNFLKACGLKGATTAAERSIHDSDRIVAIFAVTISANEKSRRMRRSRLLSRRRGDSRPRLSGRAKLDEPFLDMQEGVKKGEAIRREAMASTSTFEATLRRVARGQENQSEK